MIEDGSDEDTIKRLLDGMANIGVNLRVDEKETTFDDTSNDYVTSHKQLPLLLGYKVSPDVRPQDAIRRRMIYMLTFHPDKNPNVTPPVKEFLKKCAKRMNDGTDELLMRLDWVKDQKKEVQGDRKSITIQEFNDLFQTYLAHPFGVFCMIINTSDSKYEFDGQTSDPPSYLGTLGPDIGRRRPTTHPWFQAHVCGEQLPVRL